MDYSAVGADEHAGSPWASSPQHNRTSFGDPSGNDIPSSPIAPSAPYSHQENVDSEGQSYGSPDGHAPSTENGEGNHQREPDSPTKQPPPAQQQQQDAGAGKPHGQSQPASRYRTQGGVRKQPQPQYKLQAKVIALERTGRKDPILHFDVYVGGNRLCVFHLPYGILTKHPDQSPHFPHKPVPRCPPHPQRIPKAGRPPHLR